LSESSGIFPQERRKQLRLEFFGGPTLWRDGESVRISPFQAGLLSISFGSGQARIPRSMVQGLLWGVDQGKVVRHRLSQLVYQTNHRCRTRVISLEGECVRVNTREVATDLQDFDHLIRSGNFEAAGGLIERGFLSAFPGRKTDALADWIKKQEFGKRTHLRNRALAAWDASAASNNWLDAQVSAEALFRLDPHDETLLRRVMRARAMGGTVQEAEAMYRLFGEHADASGQWNRESKTVSLLRMVRVLYRLPARKPGVAEEADFDVPLAGRASELAHLARSIFRNASRDPWQTITVSGEAGIGKTRLVEEAIHGAHLRGYKVMRACPGDLERDIPLSPLLEALNQPWVGPVLASMDDPWRSRLISLMPQFGRAGKVPWEMNNGHAGHAEVTRRHICEALLRLFTAIAGSQPALVFLDDFHSIDAASATVVQFLHRRWQRGELTLLLCYRREELVRNELAGRLVAELEACRGSTPIRLRELTGPSAKKLVTSISAEELDEPGVDNIVKLAGGNPLFLMELAADALAGGCRQQAHGGVRVPDKVRTIIARRIAGLEPNARKALSGLAVFGRPATLGQLSRLSGRSRFECIDALESLQELRLVARTGDKVSIRHSVVRHAVYQDLSPARRSLLHKLAAEALRSGTAGFRPDRVAHHYSEAGDRELAYVYALEATEPKAECPPADRLRSLAIAYRAGEGTRRDRVTLPLARAHRRAGTLEAARRYGEEALRQGDGLSRPEIVETRLIVADSGYLLGRRSLASTLAELAHLEELARRQGDDAILAAVLDTTLLALHRAGDRDEVSRMLSAVDGMTGLRGPLANCRILATRAMAAEYGDPATGLACARQAVAIARESELHGEVMFAVQRQVAALAEAGLLTTERGRGAVALARSEARRSDDIFSYAHILLVLVDWHTATCDPEIAARVLEEARIVAAGMDCPEIRALEHLARGNLALARGDLAATTSALRGAYGIDGVSREAPDAGRDGSPDGPEGQVAPVPPNLADALAGLEGSLYLESGKFGQAAAVAENRLVAESLAGVNPELILLHARLLSRKGDTPAALTLLESAAEAHAADRPVSWLRLTLDLVKLARRSGDARPELAARARDAARKLNLSGLAHEFVPFAK